MSQRPPPPTVEELLQEIMDAIVREMIGKGKGK